MIEVALLSFAAILIAWIVAPDGGRAKRVEPTAAANKVAGSIVPARA